MMDNMLTQVTGKGVIKPLKGLLLVLGLAAGLILLDVLLRLGVYLGLNRTYAMIALYALALILFVYVFRRFCIVQMYTMDGIKLLLYRVYIRNPRFCEQILFRECVYFGDPEQAARRFAIVSTRSYAARRDRYAVQALVYKREGRYRQVLLTPNEEICAAILRALDKK